MTLSSDPRSQSSSQPVPLRPGETIRRPISLPPQPLTPFFGRQRECQQIAALLRQPDVRLVTLTGPGGAGKTRLAVQVAADATDSFEMVHFISLASLREPKHFLPTLAQELGLRESSEELLLSRIASSFGDGRTLLILDNLEQIVAAASHITSLLELAPSLTVLATSRIVLHLTGEHDFLVPPLELPSTSQAASASSLEQVASIELFVNRAQAAQTGFALDDDNAAAISELCRQLDGLPLAIELAAAQSRLLSPQAMVRRLSQRLSLLTGGPQDQPLRLQTMRDAIAWSYDLLDASEQALFRSLAVFVGGWSEDAAAFVAGSDEPGSPVLPRLGSLVDKSLVLQESQPDGEPRFRMLETVREYAFERLLEHGEAEACQARHAEYYLSQAQQAEPQLIVSGSSAWVERLMIERANLRTAVAWSLGHDMTDSVLRLSGTILSYAYARGEPEEGLSWLEAALDQPGDSSPQVQVDALFTASALAQVQGDFDRSVSLSERALQLARDSGYPFGEARALLGLGITEEWRGNLDRAAERYGEAMTLMQALGDFERLSHWGVLPLANLADIALLRGDYAEAISLGEQAVASWREVGYLWGIAQALGTVAAAACEQGDLQYAARCYDETLTHWLDCSDGRGIAGTIAGVAGLALARGQSDLAVRLIGASWALRDELGVRYVAHHLYAEQVQAETRARLSDHAFATAWSDGRQWSLDHTVAETRSILIPPTLKSSAVDRVLTPREVEVLRLIANGRSDREIAHALGVSPRTIQTHVNGVFAKLGANTRAEAVAIAIRRGLI
jgi:predicted ATPase/DNA-binding CsgD family transcriptional regulator